MTEGKTWQHFLAILGEYNHTRSKALNDLLSILVRLPHDIMTPRARTPTHV